MSLLPENERRKEQLIREHLAKSEEPGDYHWIKASRLQGVPEEEIEATVAEYHMRHSAVRGDYHWRIANAITGLGDYTYGLDDGEPPRN